MFADDHLIQVCGGFDQKEWLVGLKGVGLSAVPLYSMRSAPSFVRV